jgi:hypothetical protein
LTVGNGHEVEPLPDVRSTDARRAQIGRCAGVTRTFQVSENSVEPSEAIRARNLLSKDDARAALRDELVPLGPEMTLVDIASLSACARKRLAGAAPRPDRLIVGPSGRAECVRPDTDAGEEVGLVM